MTTPNDLHRAHLTVMARIEPAQVAALQALKDRVNNDDT